MSAIDSTKSEGPSAPTVFISYSHEDEGWKDKLRGHLAALKQIGEIELWDDRAIGVGADWYDEIGEAMRRADLAVLLVSSDFLGSDFVQKEEVPYLLERRAKEEMRVVPVLVRPCFWKPVRWLAELQMLPRDGKALSLFDEVDSHLSEIAQNVWTLIESGPPVSVSRPTVYTPPEKVDILRLPATGAELFGRSKELDELDAAWGDGRLNVISLVAWGGVGKTTLVGKWLDSLASENYRGARRVFGWSFYSQGTGERVTSADLFISEALRWFGDEAPEEGSPWDKGERLAKLVRAERTLLVLDGMEPLQSDLDVERGRVKDPALETLIDELARENPGLCIISTREPVTALDRFPESAVEWSLDRLSKEAGRALLRVAGVRGDDAALEATSEAFGNHALAISLLGRYLYRRPGHGVEHADAVPARTVPEERGGHPRRVMEALEAELGEGPELELLGVLGLFDRPAEDAAVAAVRAQPAVPGLTEHLAALPEAEWQGVLTRLREVGLVAERALHDHAGLDTHPLVREHFGERLERTHPEAWRAGHDRLFEHFRTVPEEDQPDTLEALGPLFQAVAHGCAAGRHQEALDDVYFRRISRQEQFYTTRKLGAYGADLACLTSFFDPPWTRSVASITESDQAFVLNLSGFRLRALGRLADAEAPMRAGLEARLAQGDWKNAALDAGNLGELQLARGAVADALESAAQGVELADRSGDAFQRILNLTTLADALHQAGRTEEAAARFEEAEAMQAERQPAYPRLYSLAGYRYCDLLLGRGEAVAVLERARRTLEWAPLTGDLLTIALDHLSIGRASLALGDFRAAEADLREAMNGLRAAGSQDQLPRGYLALAELRRRTDDDAARRDLDEALTLTRRMGLRLLEANAHLECTRLHHSTGDLDAAREHLRQARDIIEACGYGRRQPELDELARALL